VNPDKQTEDHVTTGGKGEIMVGGRAEIMAWSDRMRHSVRKKGVTRRLKNECQGVAVPIVWMAVDDCGTKGQT